MSSKRASLMRSSPATRIAMAIFFAAVLPGLASAASPDVPQGGRLPLLMPDDFRDLHLLSWRVELGEPDPQNPLLEGEVGWDAGGLGYHGSVFLDPLDGLYKAYLVCTPHDQAYTEKEPWASDNHAWRRLCLFTSQDGVHWSRPEVGRYSYEGTAATNIVLDLHDGMASYPSVFVDPQAAWPYEMIVLRESYKPAIHAQPPQGNGYYRYRSKDGRTWELLQKLEGPMTGDLAFFYKNGPRDYAAYYRLAAPRQPSDHVPIYEDTARRSCFRAVSEDGNSWQRDPRMALTADDRDHRDTQYQECVPLKVKGGYFALVTMYHPLTQSLNLRMAASRDGCQWWFPDRVPCLDNPPLGDYGGGMIWQSQNLIERDGRLYVYYGGTEGRHRQISDTRASSVKIGPQENVIDHGAHFLPMSSALCRASWNANRLYALVTSAGGPTVGTATTQPRDIGGSALVLNVRTRPAKKVSSHPAARGGLDEGYVQVELLDEGGKVLPGFGRDDCPPIRGDHETVDVAWRGGSKAPQDARSARFYLMRAFLYGFEFRGLAESGAAE